ncbi:MAG: FAD-dependent oxidoreductase [Lachnospiraceae bacterium]
MSETYKWPYENEASVEETVKCDVLVLGGGLAGCFAAIAAARKGLDVILVEKGAIEKAVLQEQDLTTGNLPVPTPVPG